LDSKLQETQLIITHPGSAHFDDITGVGLILAVYENTPFRIERREPTSAELNNPEIWVVDVGRRYEPDKRNFDHHQSMDCPAAFVLVADYLGLKEILSVEPWWDFKEHVDRFGAVNASRKFNAGDDLVNRNPIEDWLTSSFSFDAQACLPELRSYGLFLIRDARRLKKQIDYWKNSRRLEIKGVKAMIGEVRESAGLEEFRRIAADPPDIVISLDRRGEGWRLFRYDGAPVDFQRIAGRPEVSFAHKSGFLATTNTRLSEDELIQLVEQAVTK